MKATRSKDGLYRINITVPHRIGIFDMAQLFTARHDDNAAERAKTFSKKQIMEDVKQQLYFHGEEHACYYIDDNSLDEVFEQVEDIFDERFAKEFEHA